MRDDGEDKLEEQVGQNEKEGEEEVSKEASLVAGAVVWRRILRKRLLGVQCACQNACPSITQHTCFGRWSNSMVTMEQNTTNKPSLVPPLLSLAFQSQVSTELYNLVYRLMLVALPCRSLFELMGVRFVDASSSSSSL